MSVVELADTLYTSSGEEGLTKVRLSVATESWALLLLLKEPEKTPAALLGLFMMIRYCPSEGLVALKSS